VDAPLDGPMAPEISLDKQRPAEYMFEKLVEEKLENDNQPPAKPASKEKTAA